MVAIDQNRGFIQTLLCPPQSLISNIVSIELKLLKCFHSESTGHSLVEETTGNPYSDCGIKDNSLVVINSPKAFSCLKILLLDCFNVGSINRYRTSRIIQF